MIDDVSRALRAILAERSDEAVRTRGKLPEELAGAQIVFDQPASEFKPQQTTVDLFLYDIRENLELRSNEPVVIRKNGQVITEPPPLRMACSYLVTAWPVGGADLALQEQRLLSQVLQVLCRLPKIPAFFLRGSLIGQTPPLPMVTALVDPQKNLSEFWTALGSQLRPSLTITVTFSMPVFEPEPAAMVTSKELRFGQRSAPDETEISPRAGEEMMLIGIFGRVTDAARKPVTGATVTLSELGLTAMTDSDGRYRLTLKEPGQYTLHVQKGDKSKETKIEAKAGTETDVQLK